jgi:hypothetical protein
VLGKEYTELIYFSAANVRLVQARFAKKEAFEKSEWTRIDANKVARAEKKARIETEKADKALQAVVRGDNIEEVRIEEKSQKQAQKKKEVPKSEALKSLPVRNKNLAKPKIVLNKYRKQVRFVGVKKTEGVVVIPVKSTSRGRIVKPRVIFEQGINWFVI